MDHWISDRHVFIISYTLYGVDKKETYDNVEEFAARITELSQDGGPNNVTIERLPIHRMT